MACKVSFNDRPDVGIGKTRQTAWGNQCLVAKHLMSRKRRPSQLEGSQEMTWTGLEFETGSRGVC